jgi:hypothetical protein
VWCAGDGKEESVDLGLEQRTLEGRHERREHEEQHQEDVPAAKKLRL